jgi:hypothetical protein
MKGTEGHSVIVSELVVKVYEAAAHEGRFVSFV